MRSEDSAYLHSLGNLKNALRSLQEFVAEPIRTERDRAGVIELADEDAWVTLLQDRTLTSHTYRHELAQELVNRTMASHVSTLNDLVLKLAATA